MLSKPSYTTSDFTAARDWVKPQGGALFPTYSAFEWFWRTHRAELIESGELIARRGRSGILLGPQFGEVAVAIALRHQRASAR